MIVYQPNKNFFRDISMLAKSWTMIKIMRAILLIGGYTIVVCVPLEYFDLAESLRIETSLFSFLGIVLSILLVFRTNSAYDRWWEGRKQWGALVNNCRNLAIGVHAAFPSDDTASRKAMAAHIANFCIAFKEHLRQGTKLEELVHVSPEVMAEYKTKTHVPNWISFQIQFLLENAHKAGVLTDAQHINLRVNANSLLDILGACERIKKTPIPFSYAVYIKLFIIAYSVLLPFALVAEYSYWTVPIVMLVFFAFIGLELMAEEIEEPFGLDCNDLPTGSIAHTIKNNVYEILEGRQPASVVSNELYVKLH